MQMQLNEGYINSYVWNYKCQDSLEYFINQNIFGKLSTWIKFQLNNQINLGFSFSQDENIIFLTDYRENVIIFLYLGVI